MNDIITYLERAESEPSLGGATHRGNVSGSGLMLAPSDRGRFIFNGEYVGAVLNASFSPVVPIQFIETENAEDQSLVRNSIGSNEGLGSSSQTCGATRLERHSLTIGAGRVGHLELLPSLWIPARRPEQEAPLVAIQKLR